MEILKSAVILVIGFVLLIKGADYFVEGSSSVAKKFKVPSLIIGMTIVAMGTSLPELAVSVTAAMAGWWLGASLPLDISDTTRQIAALLTASACTWILYIVSRKVLTKISLKPY